MKLRVRRLGLSSWAQWQSGIVSWALCIARWQFFSNCFQAKALVDSLYHAYKKGTTFEPLSSFVKIVWIREQQVHRFQFCFHEFHEYISVIKDVHIVVDLVKISSVCTSKGRMYVRAETEFLQHVKFSSLKGLVTQYAIPFLLGSPCTSIGILLGDEILHWDSLTPVWIHDILGQDWSTFVNSLH